MKVSSYHAWIRTLLWVFIVTPLGACLAQTSADESAIANNTNPNISKRSKAQHDMEEGATLRAESKSLLKMARDQIQVANSLYKESRGLQQVVRKLNPEQKALKEQLGKHIKQLNQTRQTLQSEGANFREMGERLQKMGHLRMKHGFVGVWGDQFRYLGPMLSENANAVVAHNTAIRSVKPNMPDGSDPRLNTEEVIPSIMTQRGDQSRPVHLDTDPFQPSMHGHFFAHVESQYQDKGRARVPINEMHEWHLYITDDHGNKFQGLDIQLEGHMPGHVHGLPTAPEVVGEVAPGVYKVRGVKFQMTGWWVMTFIMKKGEVEDRVTFNLDL